MLATSMHERVTASPLRAVQLADPTCSLSSSHGLLLVITASCVDLISMIPMTLCNNDLTLSTNDRDILRVFAWTQDASSMMRYAISCYPALYYGNCWCNPQVLLGCLILVLFEMATEKFGLCTSIVSSAMALLVQTSSMEVLCMGMPHADSELNPVLPKFVTTVNVIMLSSLFACRKTLYPLGTLVQEALEASLSNEWAVTVAGFVSRSMRQQTVDKSASSTQSTDSEGAKALQTSFSLVSNVQMASARPEIGDMSKYIGALMLAVKDKLQGSMHEPPDMHVKDFKKAIDTLLSAHALPIMTTLSRSNPDMWLARVVRIGLGVGAMFGVKDYVKPSNLDNALDEVLKPYKEFVESLNDEGMLLTLHLQQGLVRSIALCLRTDHDGVLFEARSEAGSSKGTMLLSRALLDVGSAWIKHVYLGTSLDSKHRSMAGGLRVMLQLGEVKMSGKYSALLGLLTGRGALPKPPRESTPTSQLVDATQRQMQHVLNRGDYEPNVKRILDQLAAHADGNSDSLFIAVADAIEGLREAALPPDSPNFASVLDGVDLWLRVHALRCLETIQRVELTGLEAQGLLVLSCCVRLAMHELVRLDTASIEPLMSVIKQTDTVAGEELPHAVEACVDHTLALLSDLDEFMVAGIDQTHLSSLARRFRKCVEHTPVEAIGVLGTVSAGKSTLLNALLGCDLLPSQAAACSAFPIELHVKSTTRPSSYVRIEVPRHPGQEGATLTMDVSQAKAYLNSLNSRARSDQSYKCAFLQSFVKITIDVHPELWGIDRDTW